ncbi:hypothetical protein J0895_01955 [Phormidium pseudopriestleyi FRX01]|uniref:Aspartate ammonia-lyase n=1 Tax=Phormidium pseudopriestleyi FRX01 TaxID=1759528 RepID=A0ABS3FMK5_9CYAN|nr:hypothetical protein [Phormidium pseudopriestleyi]MBO0347891.1 hypothetical protein [Phormidium pseudopriestleyi FRX01]
MPIKNKLESTLVGVAGEYLVAGELSLRGFIASLTLRNSRGIDIIASNSDGTKSISIQVKTNSKGDNKWILSQESETFQSDNHFYIFVALKNLGERGNFFIVPSLVVAEYIATNHSEWLKGTKSDGTPRKDSAIRNFRDLENQYLEAWHLINIELL